MINDDALPNQMKLSQGMLSGQGMSYRALVFYKTVSVPVPTLLRARDFARAGGTVIAVGRLPEVGVGLMRMAEQLQEIESLNKEIWGNGEGVFLKTLDDFPAWLAQHIGPDFRMKPAIKNLDTSIVGRGIATFTLWRTGLGTKFPPTLLTRSLSGGTPWTVGLRE